MPYVTARDLKEDVLFRAGEPKTGSQYNDSVIDYLNRAYRGLAAGASEFLPEYIDDWWWQRAEGVLNLEPVYNTGTVSVTLNSTTITFSSTIAASQAGKHFRVIGHPDVFKISAHTAGTDTATLDAAYTGATSSGEAFELLTLEYTLSSAVQAIIGPLRSFREPYNINGMSAEALDTRYPLGALALGAPRAFALLSETQIRVSHGGRTDGTYQRVEYVYRPFVDTLTDDVSSIPLVPLQYRHFLSDMALAMLLADKNDDRAVQIVQATKFGIAAMAKENRRRLAKVDTKFAKVSPRTGPGNPISTLTERDY